MSVSDVFKALTHFRLQREALTEQSTDAAYNVSVKLNHKGSTKPISFQGRKKKHDAKKHLKCTHCGMRYHEAKICRIKKYQLRQIKNAQQPANVSTVKSTSTIAPNATAFSCELDPEFVAVVCGLSSQSNMADKPLRKLLGLLSQSCPTRQQR
ncbi:hypothetical protein V1505DRAFT_28476 [Lipomyces doorenjongii]